MTIASRWLDLVVGLDLEPDGRMRVALELGEPLATAPVLVSNAALLVATEARLVSARPGT